MNHKFTISDAGLFALAFLMGTGFLKLEIAAFIILLPFFGGAWWSGVSKQAKNPCIYLAAMLLVSFLWLYWWDYIPYQPEKYQFEQNYFKMIILWSLFAFFLPLACQSDRMLIYIVWYMATGAFVYAFSSVLATVCLLPWPYYGQIIDLRSLARGVVSIGNTPGIANLLCFLPIVFGACLLLEKEDRPKGLDKYGLALSLAATCGGFLLQQRTYFLIVLILQPIIIGFFLIMLKRYRLGLTFFSIILIYPLFIWLESVFGVTIVPRKIEHSLLTDARVVMIGHWVKHVWADPWVRIDVGPPPYDSLYWFHNFFADIHRLSGLKAMVAAILFSAIFFIRAFYLLWQRPTWGAFMLATVLPIFLIMNTSVVPEGECQPFVLMILLCSICESLLQKRGKVCGNYIGAIR